jgi:glycerophosphoryl diester phosphodiesterase
MKKLMKCFWILPCVLAVGCATTKEPAYDTLISHRGESIDAPENTMPAFKMAVDRGFGFECDIYLSSDKKLFAFHDGNLKRTTAGACTNKCVDTSWKDVISKVNVGGWGKWKGSKFDPTRPALFSELLSLARDGRYIYVEIKGNNPEWAPYIKEEILKAKNVNPGNVLFISFGADVLAAIKKELPEYKAYWVTSHSVYKKDKKTNKKVGRPLTVEEILKTLLEINADGVDICFNKKIVTPKLVDAIKDAGFSCHVWTVDDIANAKAAFAAGVDTLTTNRAKGILDDYNSGK